MRAAMAATILLALMASDHAAAQSLDPKAEEVIARARSSKATYTIYWRVSDTGPTAAHNVAWRATIRRGPLLRDEDTNSRAVVDCAAGTGMQFDLSVGRDDYSVGGKVAKRYCGIDTSRKIASTKWLGQKTVTFGLVDEVEIVDWDVTSKYLVTADGAVIGVTTIYRGSSVAIVAEPMSFEPSVPEGDIFSRMSLAKSVVPKAIQSRASRAGNRPAN